MSVRNTNEFKAKTTGKWWVTELAEMLAMLSMTFRKQMGLYNCQQPHF